MPTFPQFVRWALLHPGQFEEADYPTEWPDMTEGDYTFELDLLEICLKSRSKFLAGDWPVDVKASFDAMAADR